MALFRSVHVTAFLAGTVLAGPMACSFIVDTNTHQCGIDDDCPPAFPICNRQNHTCVRSRPAAPLTDDASSIETAPVRDAGAPFDASYPDLGTDAALAVDGGIVSDAAIAGDRVPKRDGPSK